MDEETDLTFQAGGEPSAPVDTRRELETPAQALIEHTFQRMLKCICFNPQILTLADVTGQNLRAGILIKNGAVGTGLNGLAFAPQQSDFALEYHLEAETIDSITLNIKLGCELIAGMTDQHVADTPPRQDRYRLIETGSEKTAILQPIAEKSALTAQALAYPGSGVHLPGIAHLDNVGCDERRAINRQ